jgi:hypothetical protein
MMRRSQAAIESSQEAWMGYPKYVSHKEVGAAKISEVEVGADGSLTVHLEGGFDNVVISHHDRKHKPHPEKGGYLVQYSDGYTSFSPAKAFEEGYTALQQLDVSGAPASNDRDAGGAPASNDPPSVTDDDDEDEEVVDAANATMDRTRRRRPK